MLTRLPLSLIVELDVPCNTKCSVTSALMNSGGGAPPGGSSSGIVTARSAALTAAAGLRDVRRELGDVLARDERGLARVHPPALGQAAHIHGVEAELLVEPRHQLFSRQVIAGERKRPAPGISRGVTVAGHLGGVDHAEGPHDPAR